MYPEAIHPHKLGISVTGTTGQSDTLWFKGEDLWVRVDRLIPGTVTLGAGMEDGSQLQEPRGRRTAVAQRYASREGQPVSAWPTGGCGRAYALCTPAHPEELTQWDKIIGLDHLRNHQA